MRLIRAAQTSPHRPATQRGSTHRTGCSHIVCIRSAPRNPKQGPSFRAAGPRRVPASLHGLYRLHRVWVESMKCTVGFNPYDSQPPWSRRLPCPAGPHGPGLRRSLNHPADRRVITHTYGCSHLLPSRSARPNPKTGPSFRPVVPEMPPRPRVGSTGLVQFERGSSETLRSDSTLVIGRRQVTSICTPLPDSRGYNFEIHPLTHATSSTLRRSAAKISPGTTSLPGGNPPQLFG